MTENSQPPGRAGGRRPWTAWAGGVAVAAMLTGGILVAGVARGAGEEASPLFGVTVPPGYRAWEVAGVAQETDPLDELRAVLGNERAMAAYRAGTLPFPDGSVLVKLAWKRTRSAEFPAAFVPGAATTVQVMVKDSARYADTGGWGFGRFIGGRPVDEAQHRTCFGCHANNVMGHDRVFTRYAP